jgi:hypothetical protein
VKAVCAALVAVVAAALLSAGARPDSPFYLVPTPTKECVGVANCDAEPGPWVVVSGGEKATYLLACPRRRGYLVGGTDARVSTPGIRVWFDGDLGASSGFPPLGAASGAAVLFHAVSDNQTSGTFQPILGCVALRSVSRNATVSFVYAAGPGGSPGPPLDLRATSVLVEPGMRRLTSVGCARNERLVGSWSAYALQTADPPDPRYARAVTVSTTTSQNAVHAIFHVAHVAVSGLAPESWVQVGAMCRA